MARRVGPERSPLELNRCFPPSCAGLTRASSLLPKRMDCRVKPGNDNQFNMTGNRCSLALSELLRERILSCVRFVFENQCSIQSAHFSTWPSVPHGITGTDEVEFFGEPSISLSEYTM